MGTAFMVAPGVLCTVAHVLYQGGDFTAPRYTTFFVIKASEVGLPFQMETCTFIGEDTIKDIALLRIENPRSKSCVALETSKVGRGTACGSLGFPLSNISPAGVFELTERFQGAHISGYFPVNLNNWDSFYYETDSLMYPGSSGSPGFLINGKVYGMQKMSHPHASIPGSNQSQATDRVAISRWVYAKDIVDVAQANNVLI